MVGGIPNLMGGVDECPRGFSDLDSQVQAVNFKRTVRAENWMYRCGKGSGESHQSLLVNKAVSWADQDRDHCKQDDEETRRMGFQKICFHNVWQLRKRHSCSSDLA